MKKVNGIKSIHAMNSQREGGGLTGGLPFSMYEPRGGRWGQTSYTFPLRTTCKKGVGGSR